VDNPTDKDAQYIYRPVGPTGLWVTVRNHNGLVMQDNSDWKLKQERRKIKAIKSIEENILFYYCVGVLMFGIIR
jgi:hypothetical protein